MHCDWCNKNTRYQVMVHKCSVPIICKGCGGHCWDFGRDDLNELIKDREKLAEQKTKNKSLMEQRRSMFDETVRLEDKLAEARELIETHLDIGVGDWEFKKWLEGE